MSDQDSNEDFCILEDMVLEGIQLSDVNGNLLCNIDVDHAKRVDVIDRINGANLTQLQELKEIMKPSSEFSYFLLSLINKRIKIKIANKKKKHKYNIRKRWAAQLLKCPPEWINS